MKIIKNIPLKVENKKEVITFETTGGGAWEVWDRFIAINKQKIFHIGNICGTCGFFFNKKNECSELQLEEQLLIEKMNDGTSEISEDDLKKLSEIIPNDEYHVLIGEFIPNIVNSKNDYFTNEFVKSWNEDDDFDEENDEDGNFFSQKTAYYRGDTFAFKEEDKYFEFVIPLYDSEKLNEERVNHYKNELTKGKIPTIMALGVLDVKTSMTYDEIPEFPTHWCFANYLLDGHHKLKAAAECGKPIRIISFLSKSHSWQLTDEMIENLKRFEN